MNSSLIASPLPWRSGDALNWARSLRWDLLSAEATLAVQPFAYQADPPVIAGVQSRPIYGGAVEGLQVRIFGHLEIPYWHPGSGLYGFLKVPEGEVFIEVDDPSRRWLPMRITASASLPKPAEDIDALLKLIQSLPMRPSPGTALAPGITAVEGRMHWQGIPVPGAVVQMQTLFADKPTTVTTFTQEDGSYLIALPGERPDPLESPPARHLLRRLKVFSDALDLDALKKAATNYKQSLPLNLDDQLTAPRSVRGVILNIRTFRLRAGPRGGVLLGPATLADPNLEVPIIVGKRSRWDIELVA